MQAKPLDLFSSFGRPMYLSQQLTTRKAGMHAQTLSGALS